MWILRGLFTLCVFSLWSTGSAQIGPGPVRFPAYYKFSAGLLRGLTEDDEPTNLVVSSFSVWTLMDMLYYGARHETFNQLSEVLFQLGPTTSQVNHRPPYEAHGNSTNTTADMEMNNRLFLALRFELNPGYIEEISFCCNAGVQQVTFGDGEGAAAINAWVANVTHGRIHDLVGPSFNPDTALVLVDTIFFNNTWKYKFNTHPTTYQTFYVRPGKEVAVAMMHFHSNNITSGSDEGLQVTWVKLPLADERFYVVIIVPYERYGLAASVRNFTGDTLNNLLDNPNPESTHVKIHMPRFTLTSNFSLIPALQKLGITDVFNASASDLSGITTSPEPLFVSNVFQKAGIHVNEEGVFAAAGSEAEVSDGVGGVCPFTFEVTADHPFLAVLVDNEVGSPLFFSVVGDPSE